MIEVLQHPGDVVELKFARPPANALSPDFLEEIQKQVHAAVDGGKRAVVLSGQPGMFSAGLDVPYLLTLDRDGIKDAWRAFSDTVRLLGTAPIPVVAAITGHSPAGGAVLALACDYRVMAEGNFTIGLNEVRVGIPIPRFIFEMARLALGQRNAETACSTGHLHTPTEALHTGFVDRVVAPEEVVPAAVEWCAQLVALPPRTYRLSRATVRSDFAAIFDQFEDSDLEALTDAWFNPETQATLQALVAHLAQRS